MSDITAAPDSRYILSSYQGARPPAPAWFDDALAHAPERTTYACQGADIELLTWGEVGKPGLLFLHGNSAHADWWSAIAPFFAADWRCAAISLSGMGRSSHRPEGYTIDNFDGEARDAIAAAKLDRGGGTIVIGHSMGGNIGQYAAAENPAVRGLILIDIPIGQPEERMERLRAGSLKGHAAHRPFPSLEAGIARFRLSPPQPCEPYMADYIARHSLVPEDGQWVWHFDSRRISAKPGQPEPPLDRIECPIAFIHGDKSDLIDPKTLSYCVAALPPGSPVVEIPDSAHHILLDQPLALIAALRALLACWPADGKGWTAG